MVLEIYKVGYLAPTKIEMLEIGNRIVTETLDINALTEKTTLADGDLFVIADSAASYANKKILQSNIIAERIRVANAAPASPDEGDIYCDSVENALYIATD